MTLPNALAIATCSNMAIRGIKPMAAPSSEHISGKLNKTVLFPSESVVLIENGGNSNEGRPALMLPRYQIDFQRDYQMSSKDTCKMGINAYSTKMHRDLLR
jgi:hypothetical protein